MWYGKNDIPGWDEPWERGEPMEAELMEDDGENDGLPEYEDTDHQAYIAASKPDVAKAFNNKFFASEKEAREEIKTSKLGKHFKVYRILVLIDKRPL